MGLWGFMTEMQALIKAKGTVSLQSAAQPQLTGLDQVLIRVHTAGLCRTDLAVMRGLLPTPEPLIPGHEFSGTVIAVSEGVKDLNPGQRVTAMPVLPCFSCYACRARQHENCLQAQILGVHCDGAFAEYLVLPAAQVYALPDSLSWEAGAFAEPVAAAAAILDAPISVQMTGAILGRGRIAELSERLLRSQGFDKILRVEKASDLEPDACDWMIETGLATGDLSPLLKSLRPGGQLIVKSRHLPQLELSPALLIQRRIRLQGVYYGSFAWAIQWLEAHQSRLQDLWGAVLPAQQWEKAIALAEAGESAKIFLRWN